MTSPAPRERAAKALKRYLGGDNPQGRKIPLRELGALLEVTPPAICRYCGGGKGPTEAGADLIEAFTGGAVLAAWWREESPRELALRTKLAALFPSFVRRAA